MSTTLLLFDQCILHIITHTHHLTRTSASACGWFCQANSYTRDAQIQGATLPRGLNFVWCRIIFMNPQQRTCFTSRSWLLEFWEGSSFFLVFLKLVCPCPIHNTEWSRFLHRSPQFIMSWLRPFSPSSLPLHRECATTDSSQTFLLHSPRTVIFPHCYKSILHWRL
jgi:hypothetical protein